MIRPSARNLITETEPTPPRCVGQYRLLRQIGRGGMSAVYLGFDPDAARPVAVKILAEHLAYDPRFVRRFRREAHLIHQLRHEHIGHGYSIGQDHASGCHYLVMEFIDGMNLQRSLDRDGRFEVAEAARIAAEVASALAYLHAKHYLHRDVKPSNIIRDATGRAKLIDFGLALRQDEIDGLGMEPRFFGTSYYMPPEQALGWDTDPRGDLYALGATVFHMLTGEVPFPGSDHDEVTWAKRTIGPPSVRDRNPDVPAELDTIIRCLITPHPDDRPDSARSVAEAFARFAAPSQAEVETRLFWIPDLPDPEDDPLASTQPDRPAVAVQNDDRQTGDPIPPGSEWVDRTRARRFRSKRYRLGIRRLALALGLMMLLGSSMALGGVLFRPTNCSSGVDPKEAPEPCQSCQTEDDAMLELLGPCLVSDVETESIHLCPPIPGQTAIR